MNRKGAALFYFILAFFPAAGPAGCSPAAKSLSYVSAGNILEFETFLVNLKQSDRLLKADIRVVLSPDASPLISQAARFALRDQIIDIFGANSHEDIQRPEVKLRLKREIQQAVTAQMGDGKVKHVYFVGFVSVKDSFSCD
ncbi:MAG TPA: flagellar basal body-associated FliL family protein [Oligoflexia bacterium]|nr:flagellar basal body-associated FliL family protein [Oligoflexia bacterium]